MRGIVYRCFVCFLCVTFLLLTGGFPTVAAEAKEKGLPIGEMVSSGDVKFEARENVWQEVEGFHFPIFEGVRIKTEKGQALLVLAKNRQIEVGQNSLFSLQHDEQFHLLQGSISFHIPSGADMSFRAGNLLIGKPLSLHAAKTPMVSHESRETIGSIALHANGALTAQSIRGPLSIHNQNRVVLATLSQGESVTIPSPMTSETQKVMVAQVGEYEYPTGTWLTDEMLGLEYWVWGLIGVATVVVAGVVIVVAAQDDDDHDVVIVSP